MLRAFAMSDFSSSSTGNIIPFQSLICGGQSTSFLCFRHNTTVSLETSVFIQPVQKVLCYSDSQSTRNRVAYEANKTAQVLFASFKEATVPKLLKWSFVMKSWMDCKAQLGKWSRVNRTEEMFKSWIFTIHRKITVCFCCCFVSHFSPSFFWTGILLSSSLL